MKQYIFPFFIFLFLFSFKIFSADISVPNLEMYSIGSYDETDNKFKVRTISDFDVNVKGGYKFEGNILLGYNNEYMEDTEDPYDYDSDGNTTEDPEDQEVQETLDNAILFRGANIKILEFAGTPLELTYFTGEFDTFLTGDIFQKEYGTIPVGTRYRGYKYFPEIGQPKFDGIYQASGTGLAISTGNFSERFRSTLYTYQDNQIGEGYYSSDITSIINFDHFKSELFAGISYPDYGDTDVELGKYGTYRGGVLLFLDSGSGGELLVQLGVPKINPETESFNQDSFYYLFEPRFRIGLFSFIATVFKHPRYYLQEEINEEDLIDFNFNFMLGDIYKTKFSGGLETTVKMNLEAAEGEDKVRVYASPYFTTVMAGVIWDFKIRVRAAPYDEGVTTMFEGIIGIKAEF